jgi:hypothetical protein
MKRLIIVSTVLILTTGCSNKSEPVSNELALNVLEERIEELYTAYYTISSLEKYRVNYAEKNGSDVDSYTINVNQEIYAAMKSCPKLKIAYKDLELTSGFFNIGPDVFKLSKHYNLDNYKKCITQYQANQEIQEDNLNYILNDDRLKKYREDLRLDAVINESKYDGKLTYNEVINIYKALDAVLKTEEATKLLDL